MARLRWLRRDGASDEPEPEPEPMPREEWLALLAAPTAPTDALAAALDADDRDARRAVAGNPALPADLAMRLAEHAADPDWHAPIMVLLASPAVPPEVLGVLAEADTATFRTSVAAHHATPGEALTTLARDPEIDVRWAVAGNPATPPEALAELCQDRAPDVHLAALINPSAPTAALEAAIFGQPDPERATLRAHASANPALPPELMRAISRRSADDAWRDAIGHVCEHPQVPPDVLDAIVACPPPPYRGDARLSPVWEGHLVANPRTSAWALAMLAARGHEITRPRVLERVGLPPEIPDVHHSKVRRMPPERRAVLAALTANPALLTELESDRDPLVRAATVLNTMAVPAHVRRLALDADARTRAGVARSITAGPLLETLTRDPDPRVRAATTDNPATTVDQLRRLTLDDDQGVRAAARSRAGEPG